MLTCEAWTNAPLEKPLEPDGPLRRKLDKIFQDSSVVQHIYRSTDNYGTGHTSDGVFLDLARMDRQNYSLWPLMAVDEAEAWLQTQVAPQQIAALFSARGLSPNHATEGHHPWNPEQIVWSLGHYFGAAVTSGLIPPLADETLVILRGHPDLAQAFFQVAAKTIDDVTKSAQPWKGSDPALGEHQRLAQAALIQIRQDIEKKWDGLPNFSNPLSG